MVRSILFTGDCPQARAVHQQAAAREQNNGPQRKARGGEQREQSGQSQSSVRKATGKKEYSIAAHETKQAINGWLAALALYVGGDTWARANRTSWSLALETRSLLTLRALEDAGVGVSAASMAVPNPDAEECEAMAQQAPGIMAYPMTSHEMISAMQHEGSPLREELVSRGWDGAFHVIWLDYCGCLASGAGRNRQKDIQAILHSKLIYVAKIAGEATQPTCGEGGGGLLAITVSQRGGGGLYRHDVVDTLVLLVGALAEQEGLHVVVLGVVSYQISTPMYTVAFHVFDAERGPALSVAQGVPPPECAPAARLRSFPGAWEVLAGMDAESAEGEAMLATSRAFAQCVEMVVQRRGGTCLVQDSKVLPTVLELLRVGGGLLSRSTQAAAADGRSDGLQPAPALETSGTALVRGGKHACGDAHLRVLAAIADPLDAAVSEAVLAKKGVTDPGRARVVRGSMHELLLALRAHARTQPQPHDLLVSDDSPQAASPHQVGAAEDTPAERAAWDGWNFTLEGSWVDSITGSSSDGQGVCAAWLGYEGGKVLGAKELRGAGEWQDLTDLLQSGWVGGGRGGGGRHRAWGVIGVCVNCSSQGQSWDGHAVDWVVEGTRAAALSAGYDGHRVLSVMRYSTRTPRLAFIFAVQKGSDAGADDDEHSQHAAEDSSAPTWLRAGKIGDGAAPRVAGWKSEDGWDLGRAKVPVVGCLKYRWIAPYAAALAHFVCQAGGAWGASEQGLSSRRRVWVHEPGFFHLPSALTKSSQAGHGAEGGDGAQADESCEVVCVSRDPLEVAEVRRRGLEGRWLPNATDMPADFGEDAHALLLLEDGSCSAWGENWMPGVRSWLQARSNRQTQTAPASAPQAVEAHDIATTASTFSAQIGALLLLGEASDSRSVEAVVGQLQGAAADAQIGIVEDARVHLVCESRNYVMLSFLVGPAAELSAASSAWHSVRPALPRTNGK